MSLCMDFIPEFYNVFFVIFYFLIVLLTSFLEVHGQGCDDAGSDDVPIDSKSEL